MDDIWIISWFDHTAFDANPIWKSPVRVLVRSLSLSLSLDSSQRMSGWNLFLFSHVGPWCLAFWCGTYSGMQYSA